jgi:hypothetical protein
MPKPHWISQFLTRPWEINAKGELAFYDFDAGSLGKPTPSARLFRERRRRSADLEARLNQLLETPLSRARESLLVPGQVRIDDWKTYRAVVLTLFLQAQRTAAMELGNDNGLSSLLVLTEDEINQMTSLVAQKRRFVRLGIANPAHSLFYPDGGVFSVLARDDGCLTGWSWGMAIPLTPSIAYAWVSETADCDWVFEQCTTAAYLQGFSLSGPKASRVVIPPVLAEQREKLEGWLVDYRSKMNAYREETQKRRADHLNGLQRDGARLALLDRGTQRYGPREEGVAVCGVPDVWAGDFGDADGEV